MKHLKLNSLLIALTLIVGTSVYAGEKYSEEMLKRELSFLAKKLLDITGKDSHTISSEAYMRPFIGICSEVSEQGILLTCVTPGTQAEKNGLLTGDIVSKINDVVLSGPDEKKNNEAYYGVVKKMKTGDSLKMKIKRNDSDITLVVTVGAIVHPSFTLEVNK